MTRRRRSARIVLPLFLLLCLLPVHAAAQEVTRLMPGVWRLDASADARTQALPSLSFQDPASREQGDRVRVPPAWNGAITFSPARDGRRQVQVRTRAGTSLYGTGEVFDPLERTGTVITLWNTDAFGYGAGNPSLYQSHPWVLGVRGDGTAFGLLADSSWRMEIDLREGARFTADGPPFPLILIEGAGPQEVMIRLAGLIGTIPLPPLWALGYHQCRWSYYPDDRVREIAAGFRDRNIPADVIWMDIDYMRGFRVFTFDPEGFPDPSGLNADLHDLGFHSVWMIDPGVKAEPGYPVFDSGTAQDLWVKTADGSTFQGDVWPGVCVFPDFTMQRTRSWWSGLYEDFIATGVDGVWNDMNEPSVFNVASKTMPIDNRHRADAVLGGPGPHLGYHNVYGMEMVRATREGIAAARPEARPFVLSRAGFIGGQRYAATWSGDNWATWEHLDVSVPMALNLGLSGQPFNGPDIGGFAGRGSPELFARWMGVGALFPFARGHTTKGNPPKEPWAMGPDTERVSRLALERRYRLLPYLYTLFRYSSETGLPVMRPLFFSDPDDPDLRGEDDAFLLGDDLLVVPELDSLRTASPVNPPGTWRALDLVGGTSEPDLPRLYLRAGAVLPLGPVLDHTGERPLDPLTLVVAVDREGRAEGSLYEDAGDGWGYRTDDYLETRYRARRVGGDFRIEVAGTGGDRRRAARTLDIVLFDEEGRVHRAHGRDGEPIRLPADRATGGDAMPEPLRVMSFNIRYGTARDGQDAWSERRPRTAAAIRAQGPDVVGTQEGLDFQLTELIEDLPGYRRIGVGRDDGETTGEFSAILYKPDRLEVLEQGTFWLSESPEVPGSMTWGNTLPRICTWARFRGTSDGSTFYLYNVHLDNASAPSREQSTRLLARRIQGRAHPDPYLVTGDFNTGPQTPPMQTLFGIADDTWKQTHPGAEEGGTFHGFKGGREGDRIDFILTGPQGVWETMDSAVIRGQYAGGWPSDHYPVTALLMFTPL